MDTQISRAEHEEFRKRIEEWEHRQDRRIELLEESVKAIQDLTISVHTLAHDMKQMLEEQKNQGKRLDKLEQEPAQSWKQAKTTIITAVLSTIAGSLATGLIFILSQSIH